MVKTNILPWVLGLLLLLCVSIGVWFVWDSYMHRTYPTLNDPKQAIQVLAHEFAGLTALFSAVSFFALLFTIAFQLRQAMIQSQFNREQLSLTLSPIIGVELKLIDIPGALKFHGIVITSSGNS